jgi:hypothetical protein
MCRRKGVFVLADYELLTPESQRILDEVFRKYGLSPQRSAAQDVLTAGATAAGAAADAMAANRSVGLDAAINQERLDQSRRALHQQRQAEEEAINQRRQDSFSPS